MSMHTWSCHICGKERPDSKISVYRSTIEVNSIPVQQTVRYCNDDPSCTAEVVHFTFLSSNTEPAV